MMDMSFGAWRSGPHDNCKIAARHRHGQQVVTIAVVETTDPTACDRCHGTYDFMGDPCTCLRRRSTIIRDASPCP